MLCAPPWRHVPLAIVVKSMFSAEWRCTSSTMEQIGSSTAPSDGIGWDGIGEEAFELSWEAAGSE